MAEDMDFGKDSEETEGTGGALISETVYKGHKILVIKKNASDKFPVFSFGVSKGRILLENWAAIEAFVKKNDKG